MERSGDAQSGDTSSAGLRNIFSDEGLSAFCMPTEAHVLRQGDALVTPTSHQAEQRLKRESNEDYSFHLESEELTDKALKRRKALQEKSKRAQRRYRERKKAESEELRRQIEELSARVSTLTAENINLQNRNSLLEKVVQIRDGEASTISQAAPASGDVPEHVTASATFLGLVYPGRGLERSIRKEHLDRMTTADYVKVWKDYVSKLTHLLLATEGDSSGAARRTIQELVEAQRWAVQALARNDRHSMMRMSVEIKRGPQAQQALQLMQARRSGDTARRSLDALGLTLEQKLAIVEVRRQFLGRMQAVVRERAALQGALQRPVPARYGDGAALNAFAETSVALEERLRALAAEEGEAFNLMSYGVRQVLTPLQDARLLVDAFPCPVDPCHLSRMIALELQDPCADALLDVDALADVLQRLLPGLSGLEPLPFLDADEVGKDVLGNAGRELLGNTVTTGFM